MARKNHYERMGNKITPGIVLAAIIILIIMLISKASKG